MLCVTIHIVKKILSMIPILILVSIIIFFLMEILPGDASTNYLSSDLSEEVVAQMRESMGLNKPAYQRYLDWVMGMLRGEFGKSLLTGTTVAEKLAVRLPVTIELTLLAMLISVLIAVPLGILSAVRRNSALDVIGSITSMIGVSLPNFWLGMLLTLLFSITLRWLPASGYTPFLENPLLNLRGMILPAVSIGVAFAATVMRQTRSALLEVLDQDYIVTANAKGLRQRAIIWRHALRNALIPVVTVITMQIGRLIGGAAICETVFALPGVGKELVNAISGRDTPVVMGIIVSVAAIVIVINTVVDIIYIIIDPRISRGAKR